LRTKVHGPQTKAGHLEAGTAKLSELHDDAPVLQKLLLQNYIPEVHPFFLLEILENPVQYVPVISIKQSVQGVEGGWEPVFSMAERRIAQNHLSDA
jgi:hypothetical protein